MVSNYCPFSQQSFYGFIYHILLLFFQLIVHICANWTTEISTGVCLHDRCFHIHVCPCTRGAGLINFYFGRNRLNKNVFQHPNRCFTPVRTRVHAASKRTRKGVFNMTVKALLLQLCLLLHIVYPSTAATSPSLLSKLSHTSTSGHIALLCFATERLTGRNIPDSLKHSIPVITTAIRREIGLHSTSTDIHVLTPVDDIVQLENHNVAAKPMQLGNSNNQNSLLLSSVPECRSLLSSKKASELSFGNERRVQKIILVLSDAHFALNGKLSSSRTNTADEAQYKIADSYLFKGVDRRIVDHHIDISGNSVDSIYHFSVKPRLKIKPETQSISTKGTPWAEPAKTLARHVRVLMFGNNGCIPPSCQLSVRQSSSSSQQVTVIQIKGQSKEANQQAVERALQLMRSRAFSRPSFKPGSLGQFDPKASNVHNAAVLRIILERFVFLQIGGRFVNGKASGPLMKSGVAITQYGFSAVFETGSDLNVNVRKNKKKTPDYIVSSCHSNQCAAKVLLRSTTTAKRWAILKAVHQLRKRVGFRSVFVYRNMKSGTRSVRRKGKLYWLVTFWYRNKGKSRSNDDARR